jgi:hypothetical protein
VMMEENVRTQLVAHMRRLVCRYTARRAKVSLRTPRDVRQQG